MAADWDKTGLIPVEDTQTVLKYLLAQNRELAARIDRLENQLHSGH